MTGGNGNGNGNGNGKVDVDATRPWSSSHASANGDRWPRLADTALHGITGELIALVDPTTEADPAGIAAAFLCGVGNAVGRGPYVHAGQRQAAGLFVVLVGETAERKGVATWEAGQILELGDPDWKRTSWRSGLVSGEGMIKAAADGYPVLFCESEFVRVLKAGAREGNTLYDVINQAWDGGRLENARAKEAVKADLPHVSLIGNATISQARLRVTKADAASGFGNRFLWWLVRRSKALPNPGRPEKKAMARLAQRLRRALDEGRQRHELTRSPEAAQLWEDLYAHLWTRRAAAPGMLRDLSARSEPYVLRTALIYALLDRSPVIDTPHLLAGLAIWEYAEASARRIFGRGPRTGDPIADRLYPLLVERGEQGIAFGEIYEELSVRNSDSLWRAVHSLEESDLADVRQGPPRSGPGRRGFVVFAKGRAPGA